MGKEFHVYILFSRTLNRYYVGQTQDLEIRVNNYHNRGKSTSTRRGIPWILVYSEPYETRSSAMMREREIKKRKSRTFLERLIKSVPSREAETERS